MPSNTEWEHRDYITTVNGNYSYVAPWKMFDGEKSRTYHMTMSKERVMSVNKDEGNMEKQQKKLYWNGRILSEFLPSPFVKKICIYFFGEPDPLKKNWNSSLRKWQMVGWGILEN